jgi:uncharacterized surface protein with fasciclin (FAS1) repeats
MKIITLSVIGFFIIALIGIFLGGPLLVPNTPHQGMLTNIAQTNAANTYLKLADVNQKFYDEMQVEGPYTVFIPTDQALNQLPKEQLDTLLKTDSESAWDRTNFLAAHMVVGTYPLSKLQNGLVLTTVQGKKLTFTQKGNDWYIDGTIRMESTDIASKNGIVHTINGVITPNPY